MEERAYTILFDPAGWKAELISGNSSRPLAWRQALRLAWVYVRYVPSGNGNGGVLSRLAQVLMKAMTLSLKPSQLPSLKPTDRTYRPRLKEDSVMSVEDWVEEWTRFNRTV